MPLTPPDRLPDPVRQLSLFGAEAADPSVADLAGLLAGPGEVVRMGGTARLTVAVDAGWRVHVLVAELARRGLAATWEATADQRHVVRTSYASTLAPLALAWLNQHAASTEPAVAKPAGAEPPVVESAGTEPSGTEPAVAEPDGTEPGGGSPVAEPGGGGPGGGPAVAEPGGGGPVKRPPAGFHLNGRRLRLWLAAAGAADPPGFLLRLGAADEACWEPVGVALAAVGLPAVLLDSDERGPAYRITGRRRLARLADLIGDRPPAAPPADWPTRA
ncbi:hypothetical protein ABGB16_04735 [Micromonospora sp. B11E3]|uniref:hypothetical protein n=1 Tax=Micromonospora sp. B11E3 TaxID=3153562 RepID=UPI00325D552A